MNKISIIIPIFNEAKNIATLINYLIKNASKKHFLELIIVDGGSTDGSQEIVKTISKLPKYTTLKLFHSKKGRAKQMNYGAKIVTGNILYFLHADSFPPQYFDQYISEQVTNNNHAGCFIMKFNSNHWWLKLASQLTQLPFKCCRGGDQSLFITTALFKSIGGFNETYKIYEDNDFIAKLYALKQFVIIKRWLITSPRHYQTNGVWHLQFHYWMIHLKKWLGASPESLNRYYLKHVSVKK